MKFAFLVAAIFYTLLSTAATVNKLVVFGDSLSDNGNLYEYMKRQLPLSPPYFEGRFSNGPVWVEQVLAYYYPQNTQAHLLDYAFGGAVVLDNEDDRGLFTLRREMDSYFLAHQDRADDKSMYLVWIGANNYMGAQDDEDKVVRDVTVGILHGLQRLVEKGAKHILVVNIPDLGRTPAARDYDSIELFSALSKKHNQILGKGVANLHKQYPDVEFIYFEIDKIFNEVMQEPKSFGFVNVTGTCCEYADLDKPQSLKSVLKMLPRIIPLGDSGVCKGYMFFDPLHPTFLVHQLLAERAKKLFDQHRVEFVNQ